jgi:wyosine [tRNA(Phe)-imidazoG37] synthetase (radical SAM superfamily)
MKRYCWLNPIDGTFSNSWNEETHNKFLTPEDIKNHSTILPNYKLITYECLNDENFEFTHHMKLR